MKTIFLGPSGYNLEKKLLMGWDVKPPCKQSDIFKLIENENLKEILLVDGYYKSIPAPWHKEILLALEKGIKVTGISSLGALRANELKDFGMIGFGWVYDFIKENEPVDDSIVALIHKSADENYEPITFAKIEIIYFLKQLIKKKLITNLDIKEVSNKLMRGFFEKFSTKEVEKILKEYEINNFKNLISEHYESIKMLDLKNFLNQDIKIQTQNKISTERTPYIFRQLSLDLKTFDYSEDFSDINLSFQCHMFLKYPYKYEQYTIKAHIFFLTNIISYKQKFVKNDKRLNFKEFYEIIDKISFFNKKNIKTNKLNLDYFNTENNIILLKKSLFESNSKYILSSDLGHRLINIINHYVHPKFLKVEGLIPKDKYDEHHSELLLLLNLCLINRFIFNPSEVVFKYQKQNLNKVEKISRLVVYLFDLLYLYLKSNTLTFYYGALLLQSFGKENKDIVNSYNDFIQDSDDKPYRLFDTKSSEMKRLLLLQSLKKQNKKLIIPLRPKSSLGTHFLNFDYLLNFVDSI